MGRNKENKGEEEGKQRGAVYILKGRERRGGAGAKEVIENM